MRQGLNLPDRHAVSASPHSQGKGMSESDAASCRWSRPETRGPNQIFLRVQTPAASSQVPEWLVTLSSLCIMRNNEIKDI